LAQTVPFMSAMSTKVCGCRSSFRASGLNLGP
jgi:hypothetical protein